VGKYKFLSSREAFKVGSLESFLAAISKTTFWLVPHCTFHFCQNQAIYLQISLFKIHFHTYTRVQKQIQNVYITCVQMFGNAKIWPYYMYNIKSWIFSYKVVKDFFMTWMKFVRVCFSIIRQIGQSNNRIQFYIVTFK
jgi:hypothetical protein